MVAKAPAFIAVCLVAIAPSSQASRSCTKMFGRQASLPISRPSFLQTAGPRMTQLGPNLFRVSVSEKKFEETANPKTRGRQKKTSWCWAAVLQMVLNYEGIRVNQENIVRFVHGDLHDRSGKQDDLTRAVQQRFCSSKGESVRFEPRFIDTEDDDALISQLAQDRPLLVGHQDSPTDVEGHAYALTSLTFSTDKNGHSLIREAVMRDPCPFSPSRLTMSEERFFTGLIIAMALIRN